VIHLLKGGGKDGKRLKGLAFEISIPGFIFVEKIILPGGGLLCVTVR
jgi:hypothetical protein